MPTNKSIRQLLELQYGKGCMFQRARIAERIEKMGGIRTYKQFVASQKYTRHRLKKLEKQMTLHHLQHQSEGGDTSKENGAIISELAHQYLHSLPRDEEEIINDMLRDFKLNLAQLAGSGEIIQNQSLNLDFSIFENALDNPDDFLVIPVYENTKHKGDFPRTPQPYNRAKTKRNFQQEVDKAMYAEEIEDDYR